MEENEELMLKIKNKYNELMDAELILNEDNYGENVFVALKYNDEVITAIEPNYFEALIKIRESLERKEMLIMCNGAGLNVFPSRMQFCMGVTRTAYRMTLGQPAKLSDIVDIFEYDDTIVIATIEEQREFNNNWFNSFYKQS